MKLQQVVLTGGSGFIGWHTRLRVHSMGWPLAELHDIGANSPIPKCDRLVHLAGVNRGTDDEVESGNIDLAKSLAAELRLAKSAPKQLVYANSIQSGNGTPYGTGKQKAAEILREACDELGIEFINSLLPNIFGEHGRPHYNSVVATFCYLLSRDDAPHIDVDRTIALAHVGHVAERLLTDEPPTCGTPYEVTEISVSELLEKLQNFATAYRTGDYPELTTKFDVQLFNTYRSYLAGPDMAIALKANTDSRGSLIETARWKPSEGQCYFSTTKSGVTRGQHYHLRKIERFVVLSGTATIQLRRMFFDDKITLRVKGSVPVAVDMPTGWIHNITNTGDNTLYTQFWANEVFNPNDTDTFPEEI